MSISKTPYGVTIVAALAAGLGMPTVLYAAAESSSAKPLEEVVVTAQRREQSLQDVPVSVGVVSGETIKEYSLQNLDQLSRYVPGFNVVEGGEQTGIAIRGFGTGLNFGFDQSVGMFVDGIYAGRERQFRSLFLDINSVEVLKGPQATLFGKSTTAGAVIISTGKPTHQFSAELGAEYTEQTAQQNYRAIINGGITDTLAGRIALRFSDSKGYMYNTLTHEREEQEQDYIARGSLLWEPTQGLSFLAKVEHSKYNRVGRNFTVSEVKGLQVGRPTCATEAGRYPPCATTVADVGIVSQLSTYLAFDPNFVYRSYDKNSKQEETADVASDNDVLTIDYDIGEVTKLKSITGYSAYKSNDQRDVDWGPANYLFEPITEDFSQWSQEFQLTSKIGSKFEYVTGVNAYKNDFFVNRRTDIDIRVFLLPFGVAPFAPIVFGGPASAWQYANLRDLDQQTKSLSAYFSGTYNFTPAWHFNAGLRWNDESKTATDQVGVSQFGTTRYLDVRLSDPNNPNSPLVGNPADIIVVNNIRATLPANINGLLSPLSSRTGTETTLTFIDWSPEAKLSWDVNDNTMLYTRYAHAQKSGGFNSATTGQAAPDRTFGPETIDGFELGAKLRLLDRTMNINMALFDQVLNHQQTSVWVGDGFFVGNAGKSRTRGFEGDVTWQATEGLRLNTSVLWVDARYIHYSGVACSINQRYFPNPTPGCIYTPAIPASGTTPAVPASYLQDLSGQRYQPTFGGTAGFAYDFKLPSDLNLTWQGTGVYTPRGVNVLDPTIVQGSRTIVDTGLILNPLDRMWEIGVLVRNATNKQYYNFEFEAPAQIGTRIGFPGAPRTVTAQATLHFK